MSLGTFQISREAADYPPPPSILTLLLDADPDERQVAAHLAHGELHVAVSYTHLTLPTKA